MNQKFITSVILLMVFGFAMQAQTVDPKISFEKTVHDFGTIKEDGGKVAYEFQVTNIGSKPLIINNVTASCGCTSPSWTKNPILPGEKGVVKAVFDPRHRPGSFNKTVSVQSNSSGASARTVLRIVGKVQARELTIAEQYPYNMQKLRLKTITQSMLTLSTNETRTKEIAIINTGDKALHLSFKDVPKAIKAEAIPSTLQANQKGVIKVTYDASKKNDFDYVRDWFYVTLDGKESYNHRIMITAKIVEDFSKMSEKEKANAPVAVYSNTTFNFGTIKEGETVGYEFPVENKGKSNLIIRKIKTTCGCTAAMPSKKIIAPGEKVYIKATFNSRGKVGNNYKPITVITNSPAKPSQILAIKGVVVKGNKVKAAN